MQLYKHWNNTDVAMCVLHKFYDQQKDEYKLEVIWFNIVNPNNIYSIGVKEILKINRSIFLKNWSLYT